MGRKAKNQVRDEEDDDDEEYEVEKIVKFRKKGDQPEYLIKWKGYEELTWENEENITDPKPEFRKQMQRCADEYRKAHQRLSETSVDKPAKRRKHNSSINAFSSSPSESSPTSSALSQKLPAAGKGGEKSQPKADKHVGKQRRTDDEVAEGRGGVQEGSKGGKDSADRGKPSKGEFRRGGEKRESQAEEGDASVRDGKTGSKDKVDAGAENQGDEATSGGRRQKSLSKAKGASGSKRRTDAEPGGASDAHHWKDRAAGNASRNKEGSTFEETDGRREGDRGRASSGQAGSETHKPLDDVRVHTIRRNTIGENVGNLQVLIRAPVSSKDPDHFHQEWIPFHVARSYYPSQLIDFYTERLRFE